VVQMAATTLSLCCYVMESAGITGWFVGFQLWAGS
jgi:hypothetical protein